MSDNTYLIPAHGTLLILDYNMIQGALPIFMYSSQAVCETIMTITAYHHESDGQVSVYQTSAPINFHSPFTETNWGAPVPEVPKTPKETSEKLAQGLGLPYACQITAEHNLESSRLVFERTRQSSSDIFPPIMSLPIIQEIDWTPYQINMVRLLEGFFRRVSSSLMTLDEAYSFHQQSLNRVESWHYYIYAIENQERHQDLHQALLAYQEQIRALQSQLPDQLPVLTTQEVENLIGPIRAEATLSPFLVPTNQESDDESQPGNSGVNDLDPPEEEEDFDF